MPIVDLVLPKLGESIMEATILKWHKSVGDTIQMDETLLDIATDKVDSEIPSTVAGKITEILFEPNAVVPIGTVIARIQSNDANFTSYNTETFISSSAINSTTQIATKENNITTPKSSIETHNIEKASNTKSQENSTEPELINEVPYQPSNPSSTDIKSPNLQESKFFSPLVMNIAQNEGVSMNELQQIKGTGSNGRVSKKDILNYIADKKTSNNKSQFSENQIFNQPNLTTNNSADSFVQENTFITTGISGKIPQPEDVILTGSAEIIEMDRMRKVIAKHMMDSLQTSAHVTSFVEADVTNMVVWREKVKQLFEKREGVKITFTPMFLECIAQVLEQYPIINSSLNGDQIILKKDINIGMATALPSGNLIVPVIKGANQLSIVGLSKAVNTLANNARLNQLKPNDTQDGTFTVTNVGTFGSIMGTPIINQPQVAILALGAIKKRPVVIETPSGDAIVIRHMMYLSMSYDHRIVDGAIGSQFLSAVAKAFEAWDPNRQWFQYL
jgi:2-oxoglutarate dehydrogenase E2 component (dihydrolipoamide succinyltransferase)